MNAMESLELPLKLEDEYRAHRSLSENLLSEGRSVYQASKAEEALDESERVDLYVGMAHAPQIRDYFELESPERLDPVSYRTRYRKRSWR